MSPVTILQCSISQHAVEGVERALTSAAHILVLQDMDKKQRAAVEKEINEDKLWQLVGITQEAGKKGKKLYAAILVKKGFTILASHAYQHVCYAQIEGVGGIISFCNPPVGPPDWQDERRTFRQQLVELIHRADEETHAALGLFVAGSTSCRHRSWSTDKVKTAEVEEGEKLWDALSGRELCLVTPIDLPTTVSGTIESCRDVAFARGGLAEGESELQKDLLLPVEGSAHRHHPILHRRGQINAVSAVQAPFIKIDDEKPVAQAGTDTAQLDMLFDRRAQSITILQCNILQHEIEGVQRALDQKEACILVLQDMSSSQRAVVEKHIDTRKKWQLFGWQQEGGKRKTHAALLVRSSMAVCASRAHQHVCYAQVQDVGGFVSFWNPASESQEAKDTFRQQLEGCIQLADTQTPAGLSLFVAGNSNCRHQSWSTGKAQKKGDKRGDMLWSVLNQRGLRLVTPIGLATCMAEGREQCFDVAFARGDLEVGETTVCKGLLLPPPDGKALRHHPVLHRRGQYIVVSPSQGPLKEAQETMPIAHIGIDTAQLGLHLNNSLASMPKGVLSCQADNVDLLWKMLRTSIYSAASQLAPPRVQSKCQTFKPDRFWTPACTAARNKRRDVYHAAKKELRRIAAGAYDREEGGKRRKMFNRQAEKMVEVKRATKAFARVKREARVDGICRILEARQDAGADQLWSLVRELKGGKLPRCIIQELHGRRGPFNHRAGIEDEIAAAFLPGFQRADYQKVSSPSAQCHPASAPSERLFTPSEIHQAVMDEPSDSPGLDRISSALLQKCWTSSTSFQYVLSTLFNMCFAAGRLPSEWRRARVDINLKADGDPLLVSSYTDTHHHACASNIYDRLLLGRLQYAALHAGLNSGHFGVIPGTSEDDAIAEVLQRAFNANKEGKKAVLTGVSLQEAHRTAQHCYLLRSLERGLKKAEAVCGPQPRLLAACKDWLRHRAVSFNFNQRTGVEWIEPDNANGIPQGSPIKSILWTFYIDPLLRAMEDRWPGDHVVPIYSGDDFAAVVVGDSWEHCAGLAAEVNEVIRHWASNDASVVLGEVFSLPIGDLEGSEAFTMLGQAFDTDPDPCSLLARVFGVTLSALGGAMDTIAERKANILAKINELGTVRNSPACIKYLLATRILFPALERGLWGLLPMSPAMAGELEKVDLIIVCWVLGIDCDDNSIEYRALCVHLGILPITERLWLEARKASYDRHGYRCTRPTLLTPVEDAQTCGPWDIAREGVSLVSRRTLVAPWERESPFDKVILPASKEEAHYLHDTIVRDFQGICVYTDGSKKGDSIGAGVVMARRGVDAVVREAVPNKHPGLDSIDHGELIGLHVGLQKGQCPDDLLLPSDSGGLPSLKFFTDSKFLARALKKPEEWTEENDPLAGIQVEARKLKALLAKGSTLELIWIPGHQGIQGNEIAHSEAGRAADMSAVLCPPSLSQIPYLGEAMTRVWHRAREEVKWGATAKAIGAQYHSERGSELRDFKKRITVRQLKSRLTWLEGEAFSTACSPEVCTQCHSRLVTSCQIHLLIHCDSLRPMRNRLRLFRGPDDADDWLFVHPKIDEYLEKLDEIRGAHIVEAADEDEVMSESDLNDEPIPISMYQDAEMGIF